MPPLKTHSKVIKISDKKSKREAPRGRVFIEHAGLAQLRRVLGEALPELARDGSLPPKRLAHMIGLKVETVRSLIYGRLDFQRDTPITRMFAANLSLATGVSRGIREHTDATAPILDFEGKPYTAATYRKWRDTANNLVTSTALGELFGIVPAGRTPWNGPLPSQAGALLEGIFRVIRREHDFSRDLVACNLVNRALLEVAEDLGITKSLRQELGAIQDESMAQGRQLFTEGVRAARFSPDAEVIATAEISIGDPDKPWIEITPGNARAEEARLKAQAGYREFVKKHGSKLK